MNTQANSAANEFFSEADLVCDEILPLIEAIENTGANRARHIAVIMIALMAVIEPKEREIAMAYLLDRLHTKFN